MSIKKNRYGFCFVFNATGNVLVIRRSETAKNRPHEWDLPGGVIMPHEQPVDGIVREVLEETGLIIKNPELVVDVGGEWRGEDHRFYYFRVETDGSGVTLSFEHSEYQWHEPLVAAAMVRYRPHAFGFSEESKLPLRT